MSAALSHNAHTDCGGKADGIISIGSRGAREQLVFAAQVVLTYALASYANASKYFAPAKCVFEVCMGMM